LPVNFFFYHKNIFSCENKWNRENALVLYFTVQLLFQGLDRVKEHTPTFMHPRLVRLHLRLELLSVKS